MTKTSEIGRYALATALLLAGLTACNKAADTSTAQGTAPVSTVADSDPAAGNLAPAPQVAQNGSTNYGSTNYGNSAPPPDYSSQAASSAPSDSGYSDYDVQADADSYPADSGYDTSSAQAIEADDPPPPLPDYAQPESPGDNYYWTPGNWSYASGGYYWVPGAWVMVPWVNALWTPPYWGYDGSHYRWHGGYWGTHVGFYGGIDYGFGYTGRGYYGAYWNHGTLNYNRAVTNVNVSVHNVYNYSVPNSGGRNRISYNGGRGGINARPTPQEMAVVRDPRTPPVTAQVQYQREAAGNRAQFASAGHAQPAALVSPRPLATSYREPAAKPPAAAMRMAAARTAPAAAPQGRPNEPEHPAPSQVANRPEPNQPPAATRPTPENRPMPENRPGQPGPMPKPAPPEVRAPQPAAAQRPATENHPAAPAPMRPVPEQRPAPQPASRPASEVRPAPQQPQRPAPETRPAPQQPQRPAPEAPRPAPQVAARPAPQPASRPAPENRPAPPAAHPAPPPPSHPAPQAHPTPPPPSTHPAPVPEKKPEEKDKKGP